jgi:hypothetical protein
VAIRFHLHPDVELFRDNKATAGARRRRNRDRWVFTCDDVAPKSRNPFSSPRLGGPRRSRQIVLAFKALDAAPGRLALERRRGGAWSPPDASREGGKFGYGHPCHPLDRAGYGAAMAVSAPNIPPPDLVRS